MREHTFEIQLVTLFTSSEFNHVMAVVLQEVEIVFLQITTGDGGHPVHLLLTLQRKYNVH